jgi:hypothetical protein
MNLNTVLKNLFIPLWDEIWVAASPEIIYCPGWDNILKINNIFYPHIMPTAHSDKIKSLKTSNLNNFKTDTYI